MVLIDRWIKILDYLKIHNSSTVEDLMDEFDISKSTIRRDLIAMEDQNLVKRTRGGVELIPSDFPKSMTLDSLLDEHKEEKIKIAKKAAALIKDNDFIFIDSGTTCYYLIDYITAKNVTVVTNGILQIQKLFEKEIETYILGGYARVKENMIIGEDTEKKLASMNFDITFLGTMGIDAEAGFTTVALVDGELKKAVLRSSANCYVLADRSKFNVRKFYTYGDLSCATVITNSSVDFDSDRLKIIYA
jgi:DeoR family fructose operon transcriptional repressor